MEAAVRNLVDKIGQCLTEHDRAAMLAKVGLGLQPSIKLQEAAPKHDPTINAKPKKKQKATKPKAPATAEPKKKMITIVLKLLIKHTWISRRYSPLSDLSSHNHAGFR